MKRKNNFIAAIGIFLILSACSGGVKEKTLREVIEGGYGMAKEYLRVAEIQLRALATPACTALVGLNGNFILMHSNGSVPVKSEWVLR